MAKKQSPFFVALESVETLEKEESGGMSEVVFAFIIFARSLM